jgi:SAM-dependent methyltransferase/uncharacterized protein (DUF1778 family)
MADWTGGYVADITYTHGYYAELNPQRLKLAFLAAGYAFPEAGTACELGVGQGISTNIHAAASTTRWFGTDFNPAQAGYARELAMHSGAPVQLFDQSFEEFCGRADLPDFDFIGLHGIWSWISDANRQVIADFIRRKLKVGGVVYISYNTQPGWAPIAPLRDLLTEHAQVMGAPGSGIVPRIDAALEFAGKLVSSGASYVRANPQVAERLAALKTQDRSYLAHEYFNRDWVPMSFARISEWLEDAKLSFAVSASYHDHVPAINLTAEQRALLSEVPDRMFRETVNDFLVNRQFRKDYWVRGARPLSNIEQVELLRRQRFVLVVPPASVTLTIRGVLGDASMQPETYRPILALLADHRPHSVAEMEHALKESGTAFSGVIEAVLVLVGKQVLEPAQDEDLIEAAAPAVARLNRRLCEEARYSNAVTVLASPVTGGAVAVGQIEKLYLVARAANVTGVDAIARFIMNALRQAGRQVIKDGKPLDSEEAQYDEALRLVRGIEQDTLPMLKALRMTW